MKKTLNFLERKLPWGLIGALIGIIGLAVGFYYAIYYEKKSEISFQIVNESDILDIHKPLKDLNIFFEGEDIQKDNLNLKVIRLKIINTGQVDILQSFYDKNEDWGFKVSNGKIIEIRPTETNSKYLDDNIKPVQSNDNQINLEKVILEKEKYISFEILVLHNKSSPPKITPVGKIASIDNFLITDSISNNNEISFWDSLFYGKLHIHIIRAFMYLLLFIAPIIIVVVSLNSISNLKDNIQRNKRKKKLEKVKSSIDLNDSNLDVIYKAYIDGEFEFIKRLSTVLKSDLEIKTRIEKVRVPKKFEHDPINFPDIINESTVGDLEDLSLIEVSGFSNRLIGQKVDMVLDRLLKNNKIIIEDEKVTVDSKFKNGLNVIVAIIL